MKVLLICPIGSFGDVYPFLDIGIALKARGHKVSLMTSGYFRPHAARAGLEFIQLGDAEKPIVNLGGASSRNASKNISPSTADTILPVIVDDTYRLINESHDPGKTVVVAQLFSVGASVARDKLRVPVAYVGVAPTYLQHLTLLEWTGSTLALLSEPIWHVRSMLNSLRSRVGLPSWSVAQLGHWLHSPGPILGLFPDWFAPRGARWLPRVWLTEFSQYDATDVWTPSSELKSFVEKEPPIVFTRPSWRSSQPRFVTEAAEACRLQRRPGLFIGVPEQHCLQQLSPEFGICGYVPLSWLMPRSAAIVHHGGVGTGAHALAAGKPQLLRPLDGQQAADSRLLRRLGVARTYFSLFPRTSALAKAIESLLLSPEIAAQCHRVADRMRGQGPMQKTCELVEQIGMTV